MVFVKPFKFNWLHFSGRPGTPLAIGRSSPPRGKADGLGVTTLPVRWNQELSGHSAVCRRRGKAILGVPGGSFGFDSRSLHHWIAQSGRATVSSTVCRGFDSRSKTVLPRQWFIAVPVGCGRRKPPPPVRPGASVRLCGRASVVGWQGERGLGDFSRVAAHPGCPQRCAPPQEPTETPAGPA